MDQTVCLLKRCVAGLMAVAIIALGSAHHRGPEAPDNAMLAAFLSAGGDISDLCLSDPDSPPRHNDDCPACTVSKVLLDTACSANVLGLVYGRLGSRAMDSQTHARGRGPRAPPARGPPAALA